MPQGPQGSRSSRSPSIARTAAQPHDGMSGGGGSMPSGVCFPLSGAKRSTTGPAKAILAEALDAGDQAAAEALRASKDKDWRFGYVEPLKKCVTAMASDADTCDAMATAGLGKAHDLFEFGRDGQVMPLRTAMDGKTFSGSLETGTIQGTGESGGGELVVPYEGVDYSGPGLISLLRAQTAKGTMDESVPAAVARLQANPAWLDLSDKYFVLIGATSEMGPLKFLLSHGANVIGIARPSGKWAGLLETARASSGTFTYPISEGSEGAGKKTPLLSFVRCHFPLEMIIFAKTGSGQT
jgi:hypothetical protein